jgi:cycloeucalenol cycloisomerase
MRYRAPMTTHSIAGSAERPRVPSLLSSDPARAGLERFVLAYSLVWIGAVAAVMFGGFLARFGEWQYLAFGVGLALPLWLPIALPPRAERALPQSARAHVRYQALIALTVLIQTAIGSQFFFERLGMEYRFPVHLSLARTPLFLYFMTVAYFSTYYVVMTLALRAGARAFPTAPRALRLVGRALLCYSIAFAETASMATERMREFFLYRDLRFTLWVGSLCYGTLFLCTLPPFERLDDTPSRPLRLLVRDCLIANAVALTLYLAYALMISPR